MVGLSVCLATIHYPDVTPDKLLTAVFGGFFIGAGMGLAMRGGAVLDGTDIAALLISKRSHLFRVGDVILGMNIIIFLTAEFFLGVEPALYSILTYLSATKTLDFLLHGLEEYTAITIVSERSTAIREANACHMYSVASHGTAMSAAGTASVTANGVPESFTASTIGVASKTRLPTLTAK